MFQNIHFIGIGGAGMSGLAVLLHSEGRTVSGCDISPSPGSCRLESLGVKVEYSHSPSHITSCRPDLIVATPAVKMSNPELAEAARLGIPVKSRGEALAGYASSKRTIAVCGTHGKTTTSSFAAALLAQSTEGTGWCIGGESDVLHCNAKAPDPGAPFVVEVDESDGTLALHSPEVLVFTSADFDHPEHFKSYEEYLACYAAAARATKKCVVVCADDTRACGVARRNAKNVVTYGFSPESDFRAVDVECSAGSSKFRLEMRGVKTPAVYNVPVPGRHNVVNALAAVAAAHVVSGLDVSSPEFAKSAQCAFSSLPSRRFEILCDKGGVKVVADYAHHPGELRCAIETARLSSPARLRVLFQPHRYSRTVALRDDFAKVLSAADELILLPVYAAFEKPVEGGSSADIYCKIRENGGNVLLARNPAEALRHVELTLQEGDTVLLAGAGDIIQMREKARQLTLPSRRPPVVDLSAYTFFRTRCQTVGRELACYSKGAEVLGMGSNRWFPDLVGDFDFCKSSNGNIKTCGGTVTVGAAVAGGALLGVLEKEGLSGLEFMDSIPGTVGGWAAMNAGAHAHEISERIVSMEIIAQDGERKTVAAADCGFSYRTCAVANGNMIDKIVFRIDRSSPDEVAALRKVFRAKRKIPAGLKTCGCVFRNPPGDSAGRLLDNAGAKGLRAGGAFVWKDHANFIFAGDGCTSSDILALASVMAEKVFFKYGVKLECEIKGLEI